MENKYGQYSLPYGILGAISHIFTYYVILCHYYGRQPMRPWKHLKEQLFNMCWVAITSTVSVAIAIVSLTRVQETQPLVVLAALQVVLSFIDEALNVHRYFQKQEGLIRATVLWGAILYCISYASIYAMAQMSKSKRLQGRRDPLAIFLVVLVCGSGALAFSSFIIWIKGGCRQDSFTLHVLAVAGLVNSLANFLAGDYAVAVLTGNTVGIPPDSVGKLYWVYWVFERLPLFTF